MQAVRKEFATPEPILFSFNNPIGACPRCQGFGNTIDYDMDLVIPDTSLSLAQGAVDPWTKPQYEWAWKLFKSENKGKVRLDVPFCDLTEESVRSFLSDSRLLRRRGDEEVQGPRARVHEPLSRLCGVPGLSGFAAAPGSACTCGLAGRTLPNW